MKPRSVRLKVVMRAYTKVLNAIKSLNYEEQKRVLNASAVWCKPEQGDTSAAGLKK